MIYLHPLRGKVASSVMRGRNFDSCGSVFCPLVLSLSEPLFSHLKNVDYESPQGDGTPLQYSCLENPMDGGAWWAAVHGVTKSRTRLSDFTFTFTFHFHALEKEMATHSSVLAWRIPGTGEPVGLPSMGSHRVRHDWSDLPYLTLYTGWEKESRQSTSRAALYRGHLEEGERGGQEAPLIPFLLVCLTASFSLSAFVFSDWQAQTSHCAQQEMSWLTLIPRLQGKSRYPRNWWKWAN